MDVVRRIIKVNFLLNIGPGKRKWLIEKAIGFDGVFVDLVTLGVQLYLWSHHRIRLGYSCELIQQCGLLRK